LGNDDPETDDDYGYLDLTPLTRAVERAGRLMALVPGLDALANRWVGMVEDVWTRISAPGLQLRMATIAAGQRAELEALNIGHEVVGGVGVEQALVLEPAAPTQGTLAGLASSLASCDDALEGMAEDGGDLEADALARRFDHEFPPIQNRSAGDVAHPVAELASARAEPRTPSERPNRYAGICAVCGNRVEAKAGLTRRKVDRWVVRHPDCPPPA